MNEKYLFPKLAFGVVGLCVYLAATGCDSGNSSSETVENSAPSSSISEVEITVDEIFTSPIDELVANKGTGIIAYGDDPEAIAISIRYGEGLEKAQGVDAEVLPFLLFLENEDWSKGYSPEFDDLGGRALIAFFCISFIGQVAWLPDNDISDDIRQRALAQVGEVGTLHGESWMIQAACLLATRTLVGEYPDFVVTKQPYAGWIDAWSTNDRAKQQVHKSLKETLPARFGVEATPQPVGED